MANFLIPVVQSSLLGPNHVATRKFFYYAVVALFFYYAFGPNFKNSKIQKIEKSVQNRSKSVRFWWNLVRFFRNLISHNLVMVPGAKLLKNEGKWWKQKWQKWKNVGFWWKLIFPKKVRPPDFKKIGPRAKYPQK